MSDHDAQPDRIKELFAFLAIPDPESKPTSTRPFASPAPPALSPLLSAPPADLNEALSIHLFNSYFEPQSVGMLLISQAGRLVRVNDAFCRLLGYAADDLAGVNFKYLLHPDDRTPAIDHGLQALLQGEPGLERLEQRCIRKDGQLVWLEFHPALPSDPAVKPACVPVVAIDISHRRQPTGEPPDAPEVLDFFHALDRCLAGRPEPAELLEWVACNLPTAFDQPADCLAALERHGRLYGSPPALISPAKISTGLFVGGQQVGRLYAAYTASRPFTAAETALLEEIAARLGYCLEQVTPPDEFEWLDDLLAQLDAAGPDDLLLFPTKPSIAFDEDYILHRATAAASLPGGASPPPLPPSLILPRQPSLETASPPTTSPVKTTASVDLASLAPDSSVETAPSPATPVTALVSKTLAIFLTLYLVALALAELVVAFANPRLGLLIDGLLLALVLLYASAHAGNSDQKLLITLALAPLLRLLSLSMPLLIYFPHTFWYAVVGLPLILIVFLIYRLTGYKPAQVGLSKGSGWLLQLVIGLIGLLIGYVEYRLLRPLPLVSEFSLPNILLPALILLVFTGFLAELIFRGLMQRASLDTLKRLGPLYISLVFAALHIGYHSMLNLAFVFLVGLFFSLVVARTRSIAGVALAHGLTNIMLYLVYPFLIS